MLTLTSVEMNTWIAALLWPLARIMGLIAAAPLFGNRAFPNSTKILLGVMLALIILVCFAAIKTVGSAANDQFTAVKNGLPAGP